MPASLNVPGDVTQPPGVAAAGRPMETIDQSSVIGTTSATVNPWRA